MTLFRLGEGMARYRKKKVVVEAIQVTEEMILQSLIDKTHPFEGVYATGTFRPDSRTLHRGHFIVRTADGFNLRADIGDWIIKSAIGDLHRISDDVFKDLYEVDV